MAAFQTYEGTTGAELVNALVTGASGFNVSDISYVGAKDQAGFYDGSFNSYGISKGIILTSGLTTNLSNSPSYSESNNDQTAGDTDVAAAAQIVALDSNKVTTYDANSLTFHININNPSITGVSFKALFGSEEYPAYLQSKYTDTAIVSVNGTNVALVNNDPKQPISINNKNLGIHAAVQGAYNGVTGVFTINAPVKQGDNIVKIAIADVADHIVDSGLIISNLQATTSGATGIQPVTPTVEFSSTNSDIGSADINAAHAAQAGYTVTNVNGSTGQVTFTGLSKSTGQTTVVKGASSNGTYTVDLSSFRDGTVTASISDVNAASVVEKGGDVSATLDTTISQPSITGPAYANKATQSQVAFTVQDPDTDLAATTVVVTDANNKQVTAAYDASSKTYVADVSSLAQGTLQVTATSTDQAGNTSAGTTNLTHDTAQPSIAISAPVAGDNTINKAEAVQGVAISGTTTAEDGQVVTVQILNTGGTAVDSYTDTVSGGAYSVEITSAQAKALGDGSYTITADISDKAGNLATEAKQALTVDETAPSATGVALTDDTGVSDTDKVTSDPALTVTPTESGGTLLYSTDGGKTFTATAPTFAADGSADGLHTVDVEQRDTAGNTSSPGSITFTLDTTAPTITSVAETGGGIGANGNGDVSAGTVVTTTVQTDGPVYVTPAADGSTPTLVFNNGGVATYTGQTGTAVNQLTFSYTVQKGQDTKGLELADVTGSDDVTDQAGNVIDLDSLATANLPSGTLVVDTTPPVASSPTDTVAQNSGPTPIGIPAPSDNLTAAGSLAIAVGALPTNGLVTLADGRTPVTTGQTLTAAQLTGLLFTPTSGLSNQGSTFTYTVADGAGNGTTGTAALNVGAAGAPTITGTHATADQAEAPVAPFTGVAVSDPSSAAGATQTLVIQLTGQGGTLSEGAGYKGVPTLSGGNGIYQLSGTAAAVTAELDALSFTPTAGTPGVTTSTAFVLIDRSSVGTSVVDRGTSVTDAAAQSTGRQLPPPAIPDAVSISPLVSYKHGIFTIHGTASSAVGVRSVEITAQVDGVATDLGAATVNVDGTFSFSEKIGPHLQGFITATETDNAGGTASIQADYSLQGGLTGIYKAQQDRYNADGSAVTATDRFKANGSQKAQLFAPGGETFASAFFDTFNNKGAPLSTFVFDPGVGLETVNGFRVDNVDHDTLSFKGSDYGNSIATVLNSAADVKGGVLITDPIASSPGNGPGTHDTVLLRGISKAQLAANQADITFHA